MVGAVVKRFSVNNLFKWFLRRPEKRVLVDNEENSEAKGSAKDDDGNTSQASGQIDDGFTQKKEKLRPKRCMLS